MLFFQMLLILTESANASNQSISNGFSITDDTGRAILVPFGELTDAKPLKLPQIPYDSGTETKETFTLSFIKDSAAMRTDVCQLDTALDKVSYYEEAAEMGGKLRSMILDTDIKTVVRKLDSKIGKMIRHSHSCPYLYPHSCPQGHGHAHASAAALLNSFLSDSDPDIIPLVQIALEIRSFNLLKILQYFYSWPSQEQFHWFQALGYKSEWYDPHLWHTHPMDWSRNLKAIFQVDNSMLLNDIGFDLEEDKLFELIVEHDSVNIYQSFNFASHKQLADRLKTLAESGSFELLKIVHGFLGINLHLEDYQLPKELPKSVDSFAFLMEQGYRYFSMLHFLEKACKCGRDDILDFLYNLDPIMVPDTCHLALAATNGHLNVLKWAKCLGLSIGNRKVILAVVSSGNCQILQWLVKCKCIFVGNQCMSNTAARRDQFNVVKWLYERFKVIPGPGTLGNASIEILEWVRSVSPESITSVLPEMANLNNLKWLIERGYGHLFTKEVKNAQNMWAASSEKMQWIFQNWQITPSNLYWVALYGDLKALKWAYKEFNMVPCESSVKVAVRNGHFKVLKWIYKISPSSLDKTVISSAMMHSHLNIAKYFDPILNPNHEPLSLDLQHAYAGGKLKVIVWAHKHYQIIPEKLWLKEAIEHGHLGIIDWALKNHFIAKDEAIYLLAAIEAGHYQIYQHLVDYGSSTSCTIPYVILAFESGNLETLKHMVVKYPEPQDESYFLVTTKTWHQKMWLRSISYWRW